eukprot:972301-Pelagomonas_calceolata.AAC.2
MTAMHGLSLAESLAIVCDKNSDAQNVSLPFSSPAIDSLPPLSADRHNTGHILHACSPVHRASKQGASMERGSSTSTPSSLSTAGRCNSDTCGPAPVRKHVRERDVKGKCPLNVLSPRHSGGKPSQTILWDNTSCSLDTLAALVAESLGKLVALFLEQAGEQSDIAWKQAGDETRKASDDLKWKHAGFSTNKERDQLDQDFGCTTAIRQQLNNNSSQSHSISSNPAGRDEARHAFTTRGTGLLELEKRCVITLLEGTREVHRAEMRPVISNHARKVVTICVSVTIG